MPAGRVALRVTFPVNAPIGVTVRLKPFWKAGALNPVLCATVNWKSGGTSVTVAELHLVVSTTLHAVTLIDCAVLMTAGEV